MRCLLSEDLPHLTCSTEQGLHLLTAPKPDTIAYAQWTTMTEQQEEQVAKETMLYLKRLEAILTVHMVSC